MRNPIDRFMEKFVVSEDCFYRETPCWEWIAGKTKEGYGQFIVGGRRGKQVYGHRFSYETFVGVIPKGLELDHLCRNRGCVNPLHLEPVTHEENVKRGAGGRNSREKTHCPKGHTYDQENTYLCPRGRRSCRICRRESSQTRKKQKESQRPIRRKTHCVSGHPFTEANTYITSRGSRQCRQCKKERERERKERIRHKSDTDVSL